jgi:glycosyltransferase involved in cell wall biosynthesis
VRDGIDGRIVAADPTGERAERLAQVIEGMAAQTAEWEAMAERARADAGRFAVEQRVAETEALYRSIRP